MNKEENTLAAMVQVRDILQRRSVSFFLDCGTLLGAVRDRKFIPWDSDVDLGAIGVVAGDDVSRILVDDFRELGCTVLVSKTAISLRRAGVLDINIKLYQRVGRDFVAQYIRRSHRFNFVRFLADVRNGNHVGSYGPRLSIVLKRVISAMRPIIQALPLDSIESQIEEEIKTSRFPVDCFLKLEEIDFYGERFPVPHDPERYLAMRYGDDWRLPKQDYDWFKDDRSLKPEH